MNLRIGISLKLTGQKPAIGLGQLDRFKIAAHRLIGLRCQDNLGPKKTHQLAPLNRDAGRHSRHKGVAPGRTDHRQTHTGVATGCLHHRLAGLELATAFRLLDNANRQSDP